MTWRLRIISFSMLAVALIGCDGTDVSEWAGPEIRISLTDGFPSSTLEKTSAVLQVDLQIRSRGGRDYSPESVTVDNRTAQQVVFDVSIPADSVYTFLVRFTQSGRLIGEGATMQEVTLETTVVDISVLTTAGSTPSIAFVPSEVVTSSGGGNIELTIRYYGGDTSTAGIAALFAITGPTPRSFTVQGADINFVDGRQLSAAWQFGEDVQGIRDIGTLRISRNLPANFCLEADSDNVRVVDRSGHVTVAGLLGACITVTP